MADGTLGEPRWSMLGGDNDMNDILEYGFALPHNDESALSHDATQGRKNTRLPLAHGLAGVLLLQK